MSRRDRLITVGLPWCRLYWPKRRHRARIGKPHLGRVITKLLRSSFDSVYCFIWLIYSYNGQIKNLVIIYIHCKWKLSHTIYWLLQSILLYARWSNWKKYPSRIGRFQVQILIEVVVIGFFGVRFFAMSL